MHPLRAPRREDVEHCPCRRREREGKWAGACSRQRSVALVDHLVNEWELALVGGGLRAHGRWSGPKHLLVPHPRGVIERRLGSNERNGLRAEAPEEAKAHGCVRVGPRARLRRRDRGRRDRRCGIRPPPPTVRQPERRGPFLAASGFLAAGDVDEALRLAAYCVRPRWIPDRAARPRCSISSDGRPIDGIRGGAENATALQAARLVAVRPGGRELTTSRPLASTIARAARCTRFMDRSTCAPVPPCQAM
jgi:hypothetical protein